MYGLIVHYAYTFEFVHVEVDLDLYNVVQLCILLRILPYSFPIAHLAGIVFSNNVLIILCVYFFKVHNFCFLTSFVGNKLAKYYSFIY